MMNGFKALGKNMTAIFGDGMTYVMNVEYAIDKNDIIPNGRGYHFFDNLRDILYMFGNIDYDIYEIEANDYIEKIEDPKYKGKYVTNNIKLIRKLSEEEIDKYIDNNSDELLETEYEMVKMGLAKRGYRLDILVNDNDWAVRKEVARHGYGLDILVNDKDEGVRVEVARKGYGLDILIKDKDWKVRQEVARQGYGLDILIKDNSWVVRREVARQGYGLDILVNDGDEDVRLEVARQGYGLDILVNDEHWTVRMEVAKQGYGLDKLVNDKDGDVRTIAKQMMLKEKTK